VDGNLAAVCDQELRAQFLLDLQYIVSPRKKFGRTRILKVQTTSKLQNLLHALKFERLEPSFERMVKGKTANITRPKTLIVDRYCDDGMFGFYIASDG
jgi:hypothetical protein